MSRVFMAKALTRLEMHHVRIYLLVDDYSCAVF